MFFRFGQLTDRVIDRPRPDPNLSLNIVSGDIEVDIDISSLRYNDIYHYNIVLEIETARTFKTF